MVEIEGLSRADVYYAEGINESAARGRIVLDPIAGVLKARYPNSLYITLQNKDVAYTPLDSPITVNYWLQEVDPSLKVEEYSTGLIPPEWVLEDSASIETRNIKIENGQLIVEEETDDGAMQILLLIFFILAFIFVCGFFVSYYVMQ